MKVSYIKNQNLKHKEFTNYLLGILHLNYKDILTVIQLKISSWLAFFPSNVDKCFWISSKDSSFLLAGALPSNRYSNCYKQITKVKNYSKCNCFYWLTLSTTKILRREVCKNSARRNPDFCHNCCRKAGPFLLTINLNRQANSLLISLWSSFFNKSNNLFKGRASSLTVSTEMNKTPWIFF